MKSRLVLFVILLALAVTPALGLQTIKVAHQNNFYPYSWTDTAGKPRGFLIDWWNLWAKKANVHIEFIGRSNDECIRLVMSDSADALAGMFFEMDMKDHLQFGEYIMRLKSILFLQSGYKPQSANLITKPIGIIRNEFSERLVKKTYPGMKLQYFDNFQALKAQIQNRTLAGFIYEYPDLRPPYLDIPPPKGYAQYLVLRADKIRPAVKEGNDLMIRLLMIGAAQITDHEIEQIVDQYTLLKKQSRMPWSGLIVAFTLVIIGSVILVALIKTRRRRILKTGSQEEEWRQMIAQGESDRVEFKSSLRWDYHQGKMNKALEFVIAKTISAFLNTEGGTLFIGVDDNGNTVGLSPDYDTLSKKNSDGFLLALTDVVNRFLGKEFHRCITTRIIQANEQEICMVNMERSDVPVFVETGSGQEFFIRTPASSQPLNMREAMEYINSHWGKKS